MKKTSKGNVLLFPHVMERYLDMALEARENGDLNKAKEYLEEGLKLENGNTAALLGLIVTYYDLGLFREASEWAEYMLVGGLGEFSEVLELYVVSLIQLEEYARVCEIITNVLLEKSLPPSKEKQFEEILRTCSLLMDDVEAEQDEPFIRAKVEEKLETDTGFLQKLIRDLDEGSFEVQLQAIEQLKYAEDPTVIKALRNYCILPHVDPVLKTFALRALKFLGVKGKVFLYKLDQLMEISLEDLPADEDGLREDQRKVIDLLTQQTYHEDPVFVTFALQIWMEYLFAAFPFIPSLKHTESWSAALHLVVGKLLEQKISPKQVALKYGTTTQTVNKRLQFFEQYFPLKMGEWKNQHLPKEWD